MINKNQKKMGILRKTGFTLVETLVAISILTLSILGTFTAVQSGLATSSFAKDQVTAFYLIQEAMEYVINIRDNNGLATLYTLENGGSSVPWLSGMSNVSTDPCYFGKTCTIDSHLKQIASCSGGFGSCPFVTQNTSTKLYGQSTGGSFISTRFRREIQFERMSDYEVSVTVRVSWTSGSFGKTITVKQSLFDKN
ncbi:MAG: prepilin-type N-terminal cleavage/methylation domain-containing protein [Candidatus Paceibacterota bacterium]